MPNRLLKESYLTSESIAKLSFPERDLFIRIILICDDYGRTDARIPVLLARMYALDDQEYIKKHIKSWLATLEAQGKIRFYYADGYRYLYMPNWEKFQQVRSKQSKCPAPEDYVAPSDITCNQPISDDITCTRNPTPTPTLNTNPTPKTNPTPMAPLTAPREEPPIADAPAQQAPATEGISIVFPLKDGSEWTIRPDQIHRMIETYPNLDVHAELMHMRMWCENNPAQRKTKAGINRFINGWLSRSEAQRLEREAKAAPPQRQTKQQQYTQRDYSGVELGDIPEWMLESS